MKYQMNLLTGWRGGAILAASIRRSRRALGRKSMAKLGPYSYPDIRFGDALAIAERIATKFKGTVSVKGLAWELGMAENSGTLFAKVAALRDFGLLDGRGELRISALARRIIQPVSTEEGRAARAEAFQRVELLRQLYARFNGELPDDMGLLVVLEELTRASREDIVRRVALIQKHLTDAIRVMGRQADVAKNTEDSIKNKNILSTSDAVEAPDGALTVTAAGRQLSVPMSPEYIDVAVSLLEAIKRELIEARETAEAAGGDADDAVGAEAWKTDAQAL